ncbi:MAG: hypothetical protein LBE17_06910, partial [Treponema sp.]|jgi:hypothetical protein|nr:hypothetical protein [Treponema sp.]
LDAKGKKPFGFEAGKQIEDVNVFLCIIFAFPVYTRAAGYPLPEKGHFVAFRRFCQFLLGLFG